MKRFPVLVIALAVLAGCSRGPRIIPDDTLVDIYAEMFMADQWLMKNRSEKQKADTTLFYEPIFEKYGYTFQDFQASIDRKLDHPEKFEKMLKMVRPKLDAQREILEAVRDQRTKNDEMIRDVVPIYNHISFRLGKIESEYVNNIPYTPSEKEIPNR